MEEFTKKLTAIREGAKKVAKGTAANMKKGLDGTAQKEVDAARQKRDDDMIRQNYGNEENYRKTLGLDTPEGQELFTPEYQKVGRAIGKGIKGAKSMFDRLVQMRSK